MNDGCQTLHVASGQIVCRPGDIDHNLRQIETLTQQAAARGARLIQFGEAAVTGYSFIPPVMRDALTPAAAASDRLRAASAAHDIVIVTGTVARDDRGHRVSAYIVYPDGTILVQHKHMLTPTELGAGIVPGPEERLLFEVDGVTAAVCICADSGIGDIWNKLAARGCQIYCGPTAGGGGRRFMCRPQDLENPTRRRQYVADMEKVCFLGHSLATCCTHRMALIATNLAGDDGISNYHPGHSSIIDSRGCTIGLIPGEYVKDYLRPQLITGEIVVQQPVVVPKD